MSKAVKPCSIILSLILLLCCVFINGDMDMNVSAASTGYVTGSNVRIRSEASSASDKTIITEVSYVTVNILGTVKGADGNTWYKIEYNSITGYIHGDYIRVNASSTADKSFEELLAEFPESYKADLWALHAVYPNWKFVADKLTMSFDKAVANEATGFLKEVSKSTSNSWKRMTADVYNWSTGAWKYDNSDEWTGASREVIAYYMDPRNFLNSDYIYMFLQQSYDPSAQTEAGLKKLVEGTFLADGYSDKNDTEYGGSYIKVIMEAAEQSGVSPYILASIIIQEQGSKGTSSLISGEYGVYNFFNFGASGDNVIANGVEQAEKEGWTTRSASIIGGAKKYGNNYIKVGQDTYFYKDFNLVYPVNGKYYTHQYAQAVHDACNTGYNVRKTYNTNYDAELTFRIPVYTDIPDTVAAMPAKNSNLNNYFFTAMSVSGLSPSFSMETYAYNLSVSANTTINVTVPDKATYVSAESFSLKKGTTSVNLKVKSQTGYTNTYVIKVTASKPVTLKISVNGGSSSGSSYMHGDTNGDSVVDVIDLAAVRLHILGIKTMTGDTFTRGDTNSDSLVDVIDLAAIRLHILGLKYLS